jgi:hypothetical protein
MAIGLAQTFRSAVLSFYICGLRQRDCVGSTCNIDLESIY